MNSISKLVLKVGTIQSLLMAGYHFFIPYQFHWDKYLQAQSPAINWSLISINDYYSFNLLVISVILMYYLLRKQAQQESIRILSVVLMLHWAFSFVYQLFFPMPLPSRLGWLNFVLVGIAAINAILFVVPFIHSGKNEN